MVALLIKFLNFVRDRRATAAVELSLILPIFVILIIGSIALYDIFRANRNVIKAANTVAELASRYDNIESSEMENLLDAAEALSKGSSTKVSVSISNVEFRDGNYRVNWSATRRASKLQSSDLNHIEIPELQEYGTLIVTVVERDYTPIYSFGALTDFVTFKEVGLRTPKYTGYINYIK